MRRHLRRVWAWLVVAPLALACNPFAEPALSAWNPPVAAAYGYGGHYPCTYIYPYLHGYEADGTPDCTVRPLDYDFEDVDTLDLP